ncbi:hypothetical protein CDV31_012242 [Fusarium ambrosium]|uniref:2EXR domain-containing protein n=1 Tax=Fusarium ambrosium TaxID=131363 RepID=A0A428TBE8_9HYPO|nr:hypothetical protein CDV31_012242 [Fusarium ambrosium]
MAFDTFHFFPNLPKEIQDLIWNAVVRPVPGTRHVHRFMVLGPQEPKHSFSGHLLDLASLGVTHTEDDNLDEHKENDESSAGEVSGSTGKQGVSQKAASSKTLVPGSCHLAIPYEALDNGPNDSVYTLDSGLWMACKASRAAMERRFTKNEWCPIARLRPFAVAVREVARPSLCPATRRPSVDLPHWGLQASVAADTPRMQDRGEADVAFS